MNIPEILVANGTGAVLVSFLLLLRVRGESKNSVGTELFCRILVVTLLAQATETISFLLDGVPGAASRFWLYLTNTVCTGATVCVGYAWRLYVDFRVYRSIGRLRRRHMLLGAPLLAAAAAVWGEVPVEAIRQVGSTFTGVEHRIEPVRTLDGVLYYNDSIGTSPTRTIAGLRSFDQKVILIAGGYDKHIPYEPLAPEIVAHVKDLVLMGATGPRIEKALREDPGFNEAALPIQHADNMQHAVELARAAAKPGDIIILSPASASFDLYPNFEVRGREFKNIVNALK